MDTAIADANLKIAEARRKTDEDAADELLRDIKAQKAFFSETIVPALIEKRRFTFSPQWRRTDLLEYMIKGLHGVTLVKGVHADGCRPYEQRCLCWKDYWYVSFT